MSRALPLYCASMKSSLSSRRKMHSCPSSNYHQSPEGNVNHAQDKFVVRGCGGFCDRTRGEWRSTDFLQNEHCRGLAGVQFHGVGTGRHSHRPCVTVDPTAVFLLETYCAAEDASGKGNDIESCPTSASCSAARAYTLKKYRTGMQDSALYRIGGRSNSERTLQCCGCS